MKWTAAVVVTNNVTALLSLVRGRSSFFYKINSLFFFEPSGPSVVHDDDGPSSSLLSQAAGGVSWRSCPIQTLTTTSSPPSATTSSQLAHPRPRPPPQQEVVWRRSNQPRLLVEFLLEVVAGRRGHCRVRSRRSMADYSDGGGLAYVTFTVSATTITEEGRAPESTTQLCSK